MEISSSGRHLVAEIEREHAVLLQHLGRLQALLPCPQRDPSCEPCGDGRLLACQDAIDDFYLELVNYMLDHFAREDRIMRHADCHPDQRNRFMEHSEAHATMMERLAATVGAPLPLHDKLSLLMLIEHWLTEHIAMHDGPLIDWLHAQIPVLGAWKPS